MLAARRSKDYWKWRMLGVFHLFIFFLGNITYSGFLTGGRLLIFCYYLFL